MIKNIWIRRLGISVAALIFLTSFATLAQDVGNPKIEVYVKNNKVTIDLNDAVKPVKSEQELKWQVRPNSLLKKIKIEFVDSKENPHCDSTSPDPGDPCVNNLGGFSPAINCTLLDELGPEPAEPGNPEPDPNFYDYCYVIHGQNGDGDEFDSLDPIVRGRR